MPLKILAIEDPGTDVLRQIAETVTFPLTLQDRELIEAMRNKLIELEGVGLAAPQVGISKQIIAIYIPESAALLREHAEKHPLQVLINPSFVPIEPHSLEEDFEGCYSVRSKMGKVPRHSTIRVRYQDESGKFKEALIAGFTARVLQHEIDHLQGHLITDRFGPDSEQGTIEEMMKIRREELPLDKQKLLDKLLTKKGMR